MYAKKVVMPCMPCIPYNDVIGREKQFIGFLESTERLNDVSESNRLPGCKDEPEEFK